MSLPFSKAVEHLKKYPNVAKAKPRMNVPSALFLIVKDGLLLRGSENEKGYFTLSSEEINALNRYEWIIESVKVDVIEQAKGWISEFVGEPAKDNDDNKSCWDIFRTPPKRKKDD